MNQQEKREHKHTELKTIYPFVNYVWLWLVKIAFSSWQKVETTNKKITVLASACARCTGGQATE